MTLQLQRSATVPSSLIGFSVLRGVSAAKEIGSQGIHSSSREEKESVYYVELGCVRLCLLLLIDTCIREGVKIYLLA